MGSRTLLRASDGFIYLILLYLFFSILVIGVYLGVRTCDIFLCFGAIVFLLYLCFASFLLYCSFFVLRHR